MLGEQVELTAQQEHRFAVMGEFGVGKRRLVGPDEGDLARRDRGRFRRRLSAEIEGEFLAPRDVVADVADDQIAFFVAGEGLPIDVRGAGQRHALGVTFGGEDLRAVRPHRDEHRLGTGVG